jgi:hypothetical protein
MVDKKNFSQKLIAVLKLIPKRGKELDNLRKFLYSDYHHIDKSVVAIFDAWDKDFKNDFEKLDNEVVWRKKFPKENYHDNKMRAYCSLLTSLIEQFLIQEELKKDQILQKRLLSKAYERKNLLTQPIENPKREPSKAEEKQKIKKNKLLKDVGDELSQLVEAQPLSAEKFCDLMFLKEKKFYNFFGKNSDKKDNSVEEYLTALDDFYFIQKLKFLNAELTKNSIRQSETNVLFEKEVLEIGKKSEKPIIKIYADLVILFENNDNSQENYSNIKAYCDEHNQYFGEGEKDFIYNQLKNYLIRKSNQGEDVQKMLFDINKELLKFPISEHGFLNMAAAACLVNDLEYCEEFITKHNKDIKGQNRNILENLAKANLSFYRYKNDNNVQHLKNILDINGDIKSLKGDLSYNLLLHVVLCKTFFELCKSDDSYYSPVLSQLTNFKIYINKQRLAKEKRETNLNFCNYLIKILKNRNSKTALKDIKIELEGIIVINKEWLKNQCN